ncbi:hypothetical protein P2R12_18840 [Cytobacillus oceanisediminis]|nr:hypothetical protein [Cytobacillus oceanisediminis]MDF2039025.1 hypothetical protein [Cytobacillus oceanisediminis]
MKVLKRKWELIRGNNAKKKVLKRKWELVSENNAQKESAQEKMGVNQGE